MPAPYPDAARSDNHSPGRKTSPTAGVAQGVGGLLHDALTLGELQVKLLSLDAKEAGGRAIVPTGLFAVAAVLGLSTVPLLLIALSQLLRDTAGWPPAVATVAAVGIGLVVAGLLAFVGYLKARRAIRPFVRSQEELSRNLAWFKDALKRQQRPDGPVVPNHPR